VRIVGDDPRRGTHMPDSTLSFVAVDVAAIAARCAADTDARRELDPEVVRSMVAAGFARHFVPTRWGGDAGTFTELMRAVATVGEACASTAWCASLSASMSRMAGAFLPTAGCADMWADGPDVVIVGSVTPLGSARPVEGGWLLSGRWAYISAAAYSDWALVCGLIQTGGEPESKLFAVPRACYSVEDTWNSTGMRGTGSHTLVANEVFVPLHRAFDRADLFSGRTVEPTPAACFSAPLQAVNGLSFVMPALGAARGAVDAFAAYIGGKIRNAVALPGVPGVQGNRATYEMTLARAAGEVDAANLLLERAAAVADQGTRVTPLEIAQNSRDCSLAADLLVTAVNRMFRTAGTAGQSETGSLQRSWRDVTAVSTHMAIQFEPAARSYTTTLLKI
jgi:two-component flavin-dependent monooxygenase/oxygenase LndZ5